MSLQFINSIATQSRFFVPFQQFIHKIHCVKVPSNRHIAFSQPRLMSEDFLTNLFSGVTHIWSLSRSRAYYSDHHLVDDDSQSEEI